MNKLTSPYLKIPINKLPARNPAEIGIFAIM